MKTSAQTVPKLAVYARAITPLPKGNLFQM